MLTAALLRAYTGESGALELLRELGYPVAPVDIDAAEWRRGGVVIPWNGEVRLQLVVRLERFDLFLTGGPVSEDSVTTFLRSYLEYNQITKSAIVSHHDNNISIFDLSSERALRRLDVDLGAPTAHALDRLNLLARGEDDSMPRICDRALDRESVTRQFFLRFRTAVRDTAAALAASFPDESSETVDARALLVLSRLLFLSFVQEKGWLNGERRFLVDRLAHEVSRGREFYHGVLVPLFFGCLNTPLHERTLAARKLGRIPYLNGGLFEPSLFERRHPEVHLANELMRRVLEQVFERFDFRADERASAGVHVDPEMLGKVFESLMAAGERAASGSFYTPREVVDLLTERAILEWVGERSDPRAALERLQRVTVLDPACGSGAFLLSALGVIERLWIELARAAGVEPPLNLRRQIVSQSLYGVDRKPEAVRLCELRLWLAIVSATDRPIEQIEPLPNLDRNILQGNSLLSPTDFLGDARADIYRDWLGALRAQRDLIDRYRAAPAAHRPAICRVIRGNDQRLALELLNRAVDADERELQHAVAPRRDLFGRAVPLDSGLCASLQQRVTDGRSLLERLEEGALDFFSFDIHFAHVMAGGGFDVVVGNPPWVRNGRIDARTRRMLADRYPLFRARGARTAFHQPDLAVAFFDRALGLAAPQGVIALLMPAKIAKAAYAAPLRAAATSQGRIVSVDDWSDDPRARKWFQADTFPLGIVLQKPSVQVSKSPSLQGSFGQVTRPVAGPRPLETWRPGDLETRLSTVRVSSGGESFSLPHEALSGPSGEWALVPPDVNTIVHRLRHELAPLDQVLGRRPIMGVKTGDNSVFFLSVDRVEGDVVVTTDGHRVPLEAVCRCIRGRNVRRWHSMMSDWMLWPPPGGWRQLPRWLIPLAAAHGARPEELRLSFVRPEHVGVKVVWKDLSRGIAAAVLPEEELVGSVSIPVIPNQTLYAIDCSSAEEAHTIAAVLNSSIAGALLLAVADRAKDSHQRYFGRTVAAVPWPDTRAEAERLIRLSRNAHRGDEVMSELDRVVARLYGLNTTELETLQSFVERRLGGCTR